MPITFLNPLDNPYKELNVEYFDAKALELQARHDTARQNWSDMVQANAVNAFIDPTARQKYLEEQQQMFNDTISKNSGNLSRGYQDVMTSIEKAKTHQYHNLNQRQVEEETKRATLMSEFGAEGLDFSTTNIPLYDEATKSWIKPMDIQANVIKADPYMANLKIQIPSLAATIRGFQTKLGEPSGDNAYLASKLENWATLSENDIYDLMKNPTVRAAYLANNPTAALDYRTSVGGTGNAADKGKGNIFQNDETFATWATGNLQSEIKDEYTQSLEFLTNEDYVAALNYKTQKALQENQASLDQIFQAGLTYTKPVADTFVDNNATYADIIKTDTNLTEVITTSDKNMKINESAFLNVIGAIDGSLDSSITKALLKGTPFDSNLYINSFITSDGTLDKAAIAKQLNGKVLTPTEEGNLNQAYLNYQKALSAKVDAEQMKVFTNQTTEQVKNDVIDGNLELIKKEGTGKLLTVSSDIDLNLDDKEEVLQFITNYEQDSQKSLMEMGVELSDNRTRLYEKLTNKEAFFNGNPDYTFDKYVEYTMYNSNDESAINQYSQIITDDVASNPQTLNNFTSNKPEDKGKSILDLVPNGATETLDALSKKAGFSIKFNTPLMGFLDYGNTVTAEITVGEGKDKKIYTMTNINAKDPEYANEASFRAVKQVASSTNLTTNYDQKQMTNALTNVGATSMTEEENTRFNAASYNIAKPTEFKVQTDDGKNHSITLQTLQGSNGGKTYLMYVDGNTEATVRSDDFAEMKNYYKTAKGEILVKGNPTYKSVLDYYVDPALEEVKPKWGYTDN